MTSKELIKASKQFTKGILGKATTESKCFMVCAPLAGYLQMCNINAELVEGEIDLKGEQFHHFWIEIEGKVIDPTASQFGIENIWLKERPSNYRQIK